MKPRAAALFIARELKDLDVPKSSSAHKLVFDQALAGAEVMTARELGLYIREYLESLPGHLFESDG